MRVHYELANFLIASWRLATGGERLPTSHGILDRALETMSGRLPSRFRNTLTFIDTPIGRLCAELPDILRAAQESYLTSEPNPTYRTAEIKIEAPRAMDLLDDLEIDIDVGRSFGTMLAEAIGSETNALRKSHAA
ncbi:UNVERIFIED_ORG: hypothetical protein GGI57_005274 [Rhizobium aethiopicum]